jgi:hypothetical protein
MNATAVHMLGYLIVQCSVAPSLLARVKAEKGTPFAPVAGTGEQATIMAAAAAALTPEDRVLMAQFQAETVKIIAILAAIFGAAGADVAQALTAANRFQNCAV